MQNKFLKYHCRKCTGTVCKWTRLPPSEIHKYRVTCNRCGCFVGWGNEAQLQEIIRSGQRLETAVACAEAPGATLADYL
jgi:hypothetical protein